MRGRRVLPRPVRDHFQVPTGAEDSGRAGPHHRAVALTVELSMTAERSTDSGYPTEWPPTNISKAGESENPRRFKCHEQLHDLAPAHLPTIFLSVWKLQRRARWRRKASMSFHGMENGQSADLDRTGPPRSLTQSRKPSRKGASSRETKAPNSISTVVTGEFRSEILTGETHIRQRADFGLTGFRQKRLYQTVHWTSSTSHSFRRSCSA